MTTVLTVIGTRPQFIKYAAIAAPAPLPFHEVLVDTGQHFDANLSELFFQEYDIPQPRITLETNAGSGIRRLAALLTQLDDVCLEYRPDALLCFGDTDSTLAAGTTAAKHGIPLIHVEAGERSCDRHGKRIHPASAPEEGNRITIDHLSSLLLCATRAAEANLLAESCLGEIAVTGDIMYDLFLRAADRLPAMRDLRASYPVPEGPFALCTVHRAVNTDDAQRLRSLLTTLNELEFPVLLPLHPRTRSRIEEAQIELAPGSLRFLPPLRHQETLALLQDADWVFTDSGGLTREAYFSGVPSLCLDDATAWHALGEAGWCTITGADASRIHTALQSRPEAAPDLSLFGDGNAALRVIERISDYVS